MPRVYDPSGTLDVHATTFAEALAIAEARLKVFCPFGIITSHFSKPVEVLRHEEDEETVVEWLVEFNWTTENGAPLGRFV